MICSSYIACFLDGSCTAAVTSAQSQPTSLEWEHAAQAWEAEISLVSRMLYASWSSARRTLRPCQALQRTTSVLGSLLATSQLLHALILIPYAFCRYRCTKVDSGCNKIRHETDRGTNVRTPSVGEPPRDVKCQPRSRFGHYEPLW